MCQSKNISSLQTFDLIYQYSFLYTYKNRTRTFRGEIMSYKRPLSLHLVVHAWELKLDICLLQQQ